MKSKFGMSAEGVVFFPKIGLFLFVFAIFYTMKISFLLNTNEYVISGLLVISLLLFSFSKPQYFSISNRNKIFVILFYLGALMSTRGNLNSYIGITLLVIPFTIYVFLKDIYKLQILYTFDKIFSITIALSLFAWGLSLLGFPLPHYQFDWKFYNFDNYYFFLKARDVISFYAFPRFQYIFTEPGYFACLCVIMIYLREFSFKSWQSVVYLVAIIMTYSLAGYALFFFGLFAYMLQNRISKVKYLIVFLSFALIFYSLLTSNNDNVISSMFAYRLKLEDGEFTGYNRTSNSFNIWWNSYFFTHGDWFWGENDIVNNFFSDDNIIGVDLRVFMARYGIIPLLFYFGSMIYYYKNKSSKLGLFFLLMFVLYYYRGYTVMFYMGFPMLYITGICLFNKKAHK